MNGFEILPEAHGDRVRIAFVIGLLRPGGAERQLIEIARNLDKRRFDPLVIALRSSLADGECGCRVVGLSPPKGPAARLPWDAALMLGNMVRVAREFRPDVVHAFLPEHATIFGAVAKKVSKARVFIANRLSERKVYRSSFLMGKLERYALRYADVMVGNSAPIIEEICTKDGFAPEHVRKIYNGIDTNRFRPGKSNDVRRRFGWNPQHFVIGMVANFRSCKRHEDFLNAAALLRHEHRSCRFLLVGNDLGKLEWSRARINQLELDGIVQIITGCSNPETIYPALDAYVCTSESEGLSNVLLEAMACGKPIVATRVGGNPEAIQDEIQGILVPPYSPEATVAALERLIDNPGLRHCMGAAGRTRVERHFSLANMVRSHEELYTELLSANLRPRAFAAATR